MRLLSNIKENRKILKYHVWKYLIKNNKCNINNNNNNINEEYLSNPLTFELCVKRSGDFGLGLFVTNGFIKQGDICAIYPGSIFLPGQPLLSMLIPFIVAILLYVSFHKLTIYFYFFISSLLFKISVHVNNNNNNNNVI